MQTFVVTTWTLHAGGSGDDVEFINARSYQHAARKYCKMLGVKEGTLVLTEMNDINGRRPMRYAVATDYLY